MTEGFVSSELFKMAMSHIDQRFDAIQANMATKPDLALLATTQQVHSLERRVEALERDAVTTWWAGLTKFLAVVAASVTIYLAFFKGH